MVSPSRAMSIKSALRDWLSISYDMIIILQIDSLRSPLIRLRRRFEKIFSKPLAILESICYDNTVARNMRLGA